MKKILVGMVAVATLSFGSATIFKGSNQTLTIDSSPQGAIVLIDGINKGVTPMTIALEKDEAKNITIKKEGYTSRTMGIESRFDFITLLGGYSSTTDLLNGNAWEYSPTNYYVELKKK
jgi:hypothetical protein